jgi:hypothetical protein
MLIRRALRNQPKSETMEWIYDTVIEIQQLLPRPPLSPKQYSAINGGQSAVFVYKSHHKWDRTLYVWYGCRSRRQVNGRLTKGNITLSNAVNYVRHDLPFKKKTAFLIKDCESSQFRTFFLCCTAVITLGVASEI